MPWQARTRGRAALWALAYALGCSMIAFRAGDAAVSATGGFLPAAPVRYATVAVLLVAAGLACDTVLTAVGRAAARRR